MYAFFFKLEEDGGDNMNSRVNTNVFYQKQLTNYFHQLHF